MTSTAQEPSRWAAKRHFKYQLHRKGYARSHRRAEQDSWHPAIGSQETWYDWPGAILLESRVFTVRTFQTTDKMELDLLREQLQHVDRKSKAILWLRL
jgi:hypothetical protein